MGTRTRNPLTRSIAPRILKDRRSTRTGLRSTIWDRRPTRRPEPGPETLRQQQRPNASHRGTQGDPRKITKHERELTSQECRRQYRGEQPTHARGYRTTSAQTDTGKDPTHSHGKHRSRRKTKRPTKVSRDPANKTSTIIHGVDLPIIHHTVTLGTEPTTPLHYSVEH